MFVFDSDSVKSASSVAGFCSNWYFKPSTSWNRRFPRTMGSLSAGRGVNSADHKRDRIKIRARDARQRLAVAIGTKLGARGNDS